MAWLSGGLRTDSSGCKFAFLRWPKKCSAEVVSYSIMHLLCQLVSAFEQTGNGLSKFILALRGLHRSSWPYAVSDQAY